MSGRRPSRSQQIPCVETDIRPKALCDTRRNPETIDVLADTWTYLIIGEAFFGARRFAEFQHKLGIPRATLSKRLSRLERNHILKKEERRKTQAIPPYRPRH